MSPFFPVLARNERGEDWGGDISSLRSRSVTPGRGVWSTSGSTVSRLLAGETGNGRAFCVRPKGENAMQDVLKLLEVRRFFEVCVGPKLVCLKDVLVQ